jgi:hypothetical protein
MNNQSIWCEISIENYKNYYPNLHINNLCPECKKNDIECFLFKHKTKFKYFFAYPKFYTNTNIHNFYLHD